MSDAMPAQEQPSFEAQLAEYRHLRRAAALPPRQSGRGQAWRRVAQQGARYGQQGWLWRRASMPAGARVRWKRWQVLGITLSFVCVCMIGAWGIWHLASLPSSVPVVMQPTAPPPVRVHPPVLAPPPVFEGSEDLTAVLLPVIKMLSYVSLLLGAVLMACGYVEAAIPLVAVGGTSAFLPTLLKIMSVAAGSAAIGP